MMSERFVSIPLESLSKEALQGIIDAFIEREGTDYGHHDFSQEDKRQAVMLQLKKGKAVVVFDQTSESVNIVMKEELLKLALH